MQHKVLLGVALILALGGAAFLIRSTPMQAASAAGADPALAPVLERLALAQERTVRALESLEARLATEIVRPATTSAPRLATKEGLAAPTPESFEALALSLDALRITFQAETQRTQELLRSAPALGGESLVDVRDRRREIDWVALDLLEERWHEDESLTDRSQYFQSARDLIEAYGPPTAIYRPKGSLLFVYRRASHDVAANSWYFRLQDDYVIEFWVEVEGGEEE